MIREMNQTMIVVPNLYRDHFYPNIVKHEGVLSMIQELTSELKTKSAEYKYCKIIMMRRNISLDLFDLFKSFLFSKDSYKYYLIKQHSVILHPKTIIISKLYRLGYITQNNYEHANSLHYEDILYGLFPNWIQDPNLIRDITYWI